jgi:hypothetical protein
MAGSCDPCPVPALTDGDIATLGGDVIGGTDQPSAAADFVVTRIHARYGKDTLGEDLIFRRASPIVGGRELLAQGGRLEQGAVPSDINNFQARYVIRHPWTGAVNCANPKRGIWGGPSGATQGAAKPARNLAFASSEGIDLVSLVKGDLPASDVIGGASNSGGRIGPGGVAVPKAGGCAGCKLGGTADDGKVPWLVVAVVILVARRRNGRATVPVRAASAN